MLYTYPVPTPPYLYNKIMANVGDMRNTGIGAEFERRRYPHKGFRLEHFLELGSQ